LGVELSETGRVGFYGVDYQEAPHHANNCYILVDLGQGGCVHPPYATQILKP